MKRISSIKVFAFAGWIMWPVVLSVIFMTYRISSQMSIETWATYAGKLQARVWFQEGKHRVLELSSSERSQFTGKKDGDFEIWTWPHFTNSSWVVVGSADQQFIDALNARMKQLAKEKLNEK